MGVTCEILVQKPNKLGFYIAGGIVKGTVRYVIDKAEDFKNISLSLIGKGKVQWSVTVNKVTITYIGKEQYVDIYQNILEKKGAKAVLVEEGTYTFDFQFELPENIPSSFKDSTGKITYKLVLEFEKDKFFSMKRKFHTELPVHSKFMPTIEPMIFGLEKELTKPFSQKRHIVTLKAEIENTLVNSGDPINILISVDNETNQDITAVKAELVRYTTYTAREGVQRDVKVIKQSIIQSDKIRSNATMEIPMTVPTLTKLHSIMYSNILHREYRLRLTIRLPLPHRNKSVEVPVVIGDRFIERVEETCELAKEDAPPSYWEVMIEDMEKEEKK